MLLKIFLKTLFRMISATAARIDQLCMRHYSTQVCAQTQVHSRFPHAHNSMGRLCNTIGGRSKAFRAPRGTRAKNSELVLSISIISKTQQYLLARPGIQPRDFMVNRRIGQPLERPARSSMRMFRTRL